MSHHDVQWFAGGSLVQTRVLDSIADSFRCAILLHESPRRTIHRVFLDDATDLFDTPKLGDTTHPCPSVVVKVHRLASGRHRLRERAKRWIGWSPARREWKALEALFAADAPVPRPRAWGRLTNGDEIVVTDFVAGEPITLAHASTRRELAHAIARSIEKLHDVGFRHGDLHLGNLLVVDQKVVLLDLQRARRRRSARERLWDLAQLEFSLARSGWNPADRQTLRDRLGLGSAFDSVLRRFLRDHLRGRARRVLRVGRNWSTAQVGPLRGLRDVSLKEETLAEIVETTEHRSATRERRGGRVQLVETDVAALEDGQRTIIVKRIAARTLRRAIGDRLRGTAAARAFFAGQASALLSDRAARPLAFLEKRRFGLPIHSLLVLEKVGNEDLDGVPESSPECQRRLARSLGEWLAEGHAWGLSHRDLKASNIRVTIRPASIEFWMVDLEDLRGPKDLSEKARLEALSQLNASLADESMSVDARLLLLATYQSRCPFSSGKESPARAIARRSLARAHRWRGDEAPVMCIDSRESKPS